MKREDIFDAKAISFNKGAYQGRTQAKEMARAIEEAQSGLRRSLDIRYMVNSLWSCYQPTRFPGLDNLGQVDALISRLAIEVVDDETTWDEAVGRIREEADRLSLLTNHNKLKGE